MTGRFVLSPRAESDLDEIWDYTADRWGLDQAETYTRQLWERIEAVAENPALGQNAPCPSSPHSHWFLSSSVISEPRLFPRYLTAT
jgi:plasmid stabilization system protein ParE